MDADLCVIDRLPTSDRGYEDAVLSALLLQAKALRTMPRK
jgi:hypothetical protein